MACELGWKGGDLGSLFMGGKGIPWNTGVVGMMGMGSRLREEACLRERCSLMRLKCCRYSTYPTSCSVQQQSNQQ